MTVNHEAMKVVVRSLQQCELKWFLAKNREVAEWKCVELLVLYCCTFLESEDMSAVQHGVAVKRP